VIESIGPKDVILVNLPTSRMFEEYQGELGQKGQGTRKMALYEGRAKNKHCYLSYSNELSLYKMNYLPETQVKRVQKVRGTILKEGGLLQIHLECMEDPEITSFRI
jgi:hypothetical protein